MIFAFCLKKSIRFKTYQAIVCAFSFPIDEWFIYCLLISLLHVLYIIATITTFLMISKRIVPQLYKTSIRLCNSAVATSPKQVDKSTLEHESTKHPLTDNFGRFHSYLRISLTERCNLRCEFL
jgi:hypothetical protein